MIYYDIDRADGITPKEGYEACLKYIVVAGAKKYLSADNSTEELPAPDKYQGRKLLRRFVSA